MQHMQQVSLLGWLWAAYPLQPKKPISDYKNKQETQHTSFFRWKISKIFWSVLSW